MRAALFGAAYAVTALGLAGLVATLALLCRREQDPDDFAAWTVELFGPGALIEEVSGP